MKLKVVYVKFFMNYARTLATLVVRPVLVYGYEWHIFCLQKFEIVKYIWYNKNGDK